MNSLTRGIISFIRTNAYTIAFALLALLCLIGMCAAIGSCSRARSEMDHNIKVLRDSMRTYQSKSGALVAERDLLLGDISTLKIANQELADRLKDMKVPKPETAVQYETIIQNELHDTVYIVNELQVAPHVDRTFAFNDEWRSLEGSIQVQDTVMRLDFTKDEVYADYVVAVRDSKVYISSNNPYVKYTSVDGITLPSNKKKWSIGIGPSVGVGYDFVAKKFGPYVGVSLNLNYNLLEFGRK